MGFWGGLWNGVCSTVSDICSGVVEFSKAVGSVVSTAIKTVAKLGSEVLSVAKPLVAVLSVVAPHIGKKLEGVIAIAEAIIHVAATIAGFIDEDDDIEDLGERAMEAAEQNIVLEDYDNPKDYFDRIKQIELDPQSTKYTPEQKQIAGMSVLATALYLDFNVTPELIGLFVLHNDFFTKERVAAYIEYAKQQHKDLNKIQYCFLSNVTAADKQAGKDVFFGAEQAYDQHVDQDAFEDKLYDLRFGPVPKTSDVSSAAADSATTKA